MLNNLSKDMLIKLILTMREKGEKDKLELDLFREKYPNSFQFTHCSYENCITIMCQDAGFYSSTVNCDYIALCENCLKLFCNKHLKIKFNDSFCSNNFYCCDCFKIKSPEK